LYNVKISFIGPDGEQNYIAEAMLPALPQAGDTITQRSSGKDGFSAFIVRSTRWNLVQDGDSSSLDEVWVFAEFADAGQFNSASHEQCLEFYRAEGLEVPDFPLLGS